MSWFGDPWPSARLRAPICEDDRERIKTPVDEACLHCNELIKDGDRGTSMGSVYIADDGTPTAAIGYVHIECSLRSVMGNHIHLAGECQHIGDCNERSTLSFREEALEVWRMTGGDRELPTTR